MSDVITDEMTKYRKTMNWHIHVKTAILIHNKIIPAALLPALFLNHCMGLFTSWFMPADGASASCY